MLNWCWAVDEIVRGKHADHGRHPKFCMRRTAFSKGWLNP